VFKYLLHRRSAGDVDSRRQMLRFHLGLAKERGADLFNLCREMPREQAEVMERLYNEADRPEFGLVSHTYLSTVGPDARQPVCLYAVQFREGTLFVYVPGSPTAHRDLVIGDLVRKRLPVLTQVAVLVTDLQNSTRIWSELPPEEYFDLINDIWLAVDPILRRHHGTQGKHAGDGMVCYFFPRPDGNYVWDAVEAAHETRDAMRQVSKQWQARKGWTTELYLNTGLNEGQEWLGMFESTSRTEFTMLGDTINHAARLSDFARSGAVWVTKNLIGKLTGEERARLRYGVRRKNSDGHDVFVSSVFSDVDGLTDPATPRSERLSDIARLPITEIVDIAAPDKRADRAAGQNPT
jgi:adenylate cyclase